jgi:hypothetical protein
LRTASLLLRYTDMLIGESGQVQWGAARAPTFIIGFNATTTIRLLKNVKMPITTACGNIES